MMGYALVISMIFFFTYAILYLLNMFSSFGYYINGYDLITISCWSSFIVFIGIFLYFISFQLVDSGVLMLVRCINEYYGAPQDLKDNEFEDLRWMIKHGGAAVIEYQWRHWLIIPTDDEIYLLTKTSKIGGEFHIVSKMDEDKTTIIRREKGKKLAYTGLGITFWNIIRDNTTICDDEFKVYNGLPVCCKGKGCEMAEEIAKSGNIVKPICGVSVTEIYADYYFGVCSKFPRSREELESILSKAVEILEIFNPDNVDEYS